LAGAVVPKGKLLAVVVVLMSSLRIAVKLEATEVTYHTVSTPALPQPDRPVLDLPTSEGWKAEFTLVLVMYLHVFRCI